jgi:hypothetical protein
MVVTAAEIPDLLQSGSLNQIKNQGVNGLLASGGLSDRCFSQARTEVGFDQIN